jgi:hypothetical protein
MLLQKQLFINHSARMISFQVQARSNLGMSNAVISVIDPFEESRRLAEAATTNISQEWRRFGRNNHNSAL